MTLRPPLARQLDLQPHPEGGWFRETWRSPVTFAPDGYAGTRSAATAIYYLLHPGERSRWHLVRSDELWFWHSGGPLALRLRGADPSPEGTGSEGSAANASGSEGSAANSGGSFGSVASGMGLDSPTPTETVNVLLGPGVFAGQQPQVLVPGGTWQSAAPVADEPVLVSCVVAPGFDFADFRLL